MGPTVLFTIYLSIDKTSTHYRQYIYTLHDKIPKQYRQDKISEQYKTSSHGVKLDLAVKLFYVILMAVFGIAQAHVMLI